MNSLEEVIFCRWQSGGVVLNLLSEQNRRSGMGKEVCCEFLDDGHHDTPYTRPLSYENTMKLSGKDGSKAHFSILERDGQDLQSQPYIFRM